MGIMSKLTKSGIVKKAVDEAKKPQNQAKAREAFEKVKGKQSGGRRHP